MSPIEVTYRLRLSLLAIRHAGGRVGMLAEKLGKSPAQVSQWINASKDSKTGKPRSLSREMARQIEGALQLPPGWMDQPLADDERAEIVKLGNADMAAAASISNVEPGPELVGNVPLISWVAASTWYEAADPFAPGDAEEWLQCPARHSPRTYALRVRGDSMTAPHGNMRTYPEGCVIFVDPEKRSPVNGDRIIARQAGATAVTFKVYKCEDGRHWLMPLNPAHEPIRESFSVLGTIIGKWEDG